MEANQILQSNLLDILFEGRNKSYGAYDLRNTYHKRITRALLITGTVIAVLIIGSAIAKNLQPTVALTNWVTDDHTLAEVPEDIPEPEIPKPKVNTLPPVATVKVTTPEIVDDKDVLQPPPHQEEIADAAIGLKTVEGPRDIGIIAPPEAVIGTQVVAGGAIKKDNEDSVFYKVEIDAMFPGGPDAWSKYVSRAISRELDEFSDNDFGTCTVEFIVDKQGNVSDVHALNMKGSLLAEIAVNSIRKGPKWIPAVQNGVHVNARRLQPVTLLQP